MDLDAAKPKAAFTPGAQKIETWSGWDPKRGTYQKADMPKVHDCNKSDKPVMDVMMIFFLKFFLS